MKQGGQSWNVMQGGSKGVKDRRVCKFCGRRYKMQWALDNHQKLCEDYNKTTQGGQK